MAPLTNVEGEMEASSIITQVTREEDQITSFAQEKGKKKFSEKVYLNENSPAKKKKFTSCWGLGVWWEDSLREGGEQQITALRS